MKLSVKSDYAVRAVLGLARAHASGGVRRVEELAVEQGVSANYLVQILLELKSARIVKSQRGKDGGYLLARSPDQVTFGEVLRAIHGEVFEPPALSDSRCPRELRGAWAKLKSAVDAAADQISFQSLMDEGVDGSRMYYI
ncbi:MAG: RrF2 family transcriptional regulator [Limisphaerales bacterium]